MAPTVSTEQLARLLCRDVRTIQRLGVQGVLVRARNEDGSPKRGSFEMIPSIQGFIHYLDDQLGLAALHDTDFRIERTGLVKAQREHAELELAIFKGQLHRAADVPNENF